MEQSLSWEADRHSVKIFPSFMNSKFHNRVYKGPPLVPFYCSPFSDFKKCLQWSQKMPGYFSVLNRFSFQHRYLLLYNKTLHRIHSTYLWPKSQSEFRAKKLICTVYSWAVYSFNFLHFSILVILSSLLSFSCPSSSFSIVSLFLFCFLPFKGQDFSLRHHVQIGPGAIQSPIQWVSEAFSAGGGVRHLELEPDHSPPTCTEVMNTSSQRGT